MRKPMADMIRVHAKLLRLLDEVEQTRKELRERVAAAHASGESIAEIGRQLGVTRSRVYQILEQAERQ
jgi:DNA-directed RNA polymerase sigma subunit (sigma70/sigma32)